MGGHIKDFYNLKFLLQDGRHWHSCSSDSRPTSSEGQLLDLVQTFSIPTMSWSRQLSATILRHATPSLHGVSNPAILLSGARYASRFSPTSPYPGTFDIKDMLGKALDFKGSLSEDRSPADMWANKSDNLKLPPPPDTWTGMSVNP